MYIRGFVGRTREGQGRRGGRWFVKRIEERERNERTEYERENGGGRGRQSVKRISLRKKRVRTEERGLCARV